MKKGAGLKARMIALGVQDMSGSPYLAGSIEMLAAVLADAGQVHGSYKAGIEYTDDDLVRAHAAYLPLFEEYVRNTGRKRSVTVCHGLQLLVNTGRNSSCEGIESRGPGVPYGYFYQASIRHPGIRYPGTHLIRDGDMEDARERVAMEIARLIASGDDVEAVASTIVSTSTIWKRDIFLKMPFPIGGAGAGDCDTIRLWIGQMVNERFENLHDTNGTRADGNLIETLTKAKAKADLPQPENMRGARIIEVRDHYTSSSSTRYVVPPEVVKPGYGCGHDDPEKYGSTKHLYVTLTDEYADIARVHGGDLPLHVSTFGDLRPEMFLDASEMEEGLEIKCDHRGHQVRYMNRTHPVRGAGRAQIRESILAGMEAIRETSRRSSEKPVVMKELHLTVMNGMDDGFRSRLRSFLQNVHKAKATNEKVEPVTNCMDEVFVTVKASKAIDPIFKIDFGPDISLAGSVLTIRRDIGLPETVRQNLRGRPIEELVEHPLLTGAVIRQMRDVNNHGKITTAVDIDLGADVIWTDDLPLAA